MNITPETLAAIAKCDAAITADAAMHAARLAAKADAGCPWHDETLPRCASGHAAYVYGCEACFQKRAAEREGR